MKKIIFTAILLIGFAQSDKMKEKAKEKVEQINTQITTSDKSLALTDEQREQIFIVQINMMKEVKVLRKEKAEKNAIKAVYKKYGQKIFKEILTKEQMKARKISRENK